MIDRKCYRRCMNHCRRNTVLARERCSEYCESICGDEEVDDIDRLSDYEEEWLEEDLDYWG